MVDLTEDVQDFLVQAYEDLDVIDNDLVELEKNPSDTTRVDNIFRCLHSIKGCSGFVEFNKLGNIAHAGENLLSKVRETHNVNTIVISTLLEVGDTIRKMLSIIESTGNEGDNEYSDLLKKLRDLQKNNNQLENTADNSDDIQRLGSILVDSSFVAYDDVCSAIEEQKKGDSRFIGEILIDNNQVKPDDISKGLQYQKENSSLVGQTIRVDVALLDSLMSRVGELILTRNQILSQVSKYKATNLIGASERLDQITDNIQECIIEARLQPINKVWSKFPRVVRDLSVKCGKSVEIHFKGEETALDKSMIEAINEPLVHLIRNSVDHGIETPAIREAAGKPTQGTLLLRAYHDNNVMNIEVSDDGSGIDSNKIKEKALSKNLIDVADADKLSEKDCLNLIFQPGFSTANEVTDISGRGVGMDVVKTQIEKIGGTVDIESRIGEGTTTVITLPLSLALVPALIVTTSGETFAIPAASLEEVIKLEGAEANHAVHSLQETQQICINGEDLPVIDLAKELMIKNIGSENEAGIEQKSVSLVVLHSEDIKFALLVDSVSDIEDIVVKSQDKNSRSLLIFSGATFTSDGRGALILDAIGLNHVYLKNC